MTITYARVATALAIVTSLSSGAVAAVHVSAGSVGPKQLKRDAVTQEKLHSNAVSGPKVANGSLRSADVAPADRGAAPLGAVGPKGPAGDAGPDQLAEVNYAVTTQQIAPTAWTRVVAQPCPPRFAAASVGATIGGVASADAAVTGIVLPRASVYFANGTTDTQNATVTLVCIRYF